MEFRQEPGPRGPRHLVNGKSLYSAYDPLRDARAWVASLGLSPRGTLFLAGDSAGWLETAIAEGSPDGRVVHLLPHADCLVGRDRAWCWSPESGDLEAFLRDALERTGPADCAWQVWPAFERAAPETTLAWATSFRDVYRTVQGSWLTARQNGRSWWRNSLRNFVGWERPVRLVPGTRPIVVAASGPSLDEGWETLRRHRHRFDLWALPSSFHALRLRGLTPDAGVTTDGGFYAREHLQRLAGAEVPLLSALSGAADPWLEQAPVAFFAQGLPLERALLTRLPGVAFEVPSQGTVAVTALQLALAATRGPVFVAGLDLAFRDFRAHVSGHTVDRRLADRIGRRSPGETLWAERSYAQATLTVAPGTRTSPALRTYAAWLGSAPRFARQVVRVAPSPVALASFGELAWADLGDSLPPGDPVTWAKVANWPGRGRRRDLASALLRGLPETLEACDDGEVRSWAFAAVPDTLQEALRCAKSPSPRPGPDLRRAVAAFAADLGAW